MPFTIHLEALKRQWDFNITRGQEVVPDPLPEDFRNTVNHGLPVRAIPHFEFPLAVYMHPNVPTRIVYHRNDRHEVVHEEEIPLEHLTRVICCEAHKSGGPKDCLECNDLLASALEQGFVREPYVPQAPSKPDDDFYGPQKSTRKLGEKNEKR